MLLKCGKIQTLAPGATQHQNPGLQCPKMRILGETFKGMAWHPSIPTSREEPQIFLYSPLITTEASFLWTVRVANSEEWQGGYKWEVVALSKLVSGQWPRRSSRKRFLKNSIWSWASEAAVWREGKPRDNALRLAKLQEMEIGTKHSCPWKYGRCSQASRTAKSVADQGRMNTGSHTEWGQRRCLKKQRRHTDLC